MGRTDGRRSEPEECPECHRGVSCNCDDDMGDGEDFDATIEPESQGQTTFQHRPGVLPEPEWDDG